MSFEKRKIRVGRVIRDKTDKSVVVLFEWRRPHPLYKRPIRRSSKFNVHDESNTAIIGDLVKVIESRPYSKTKRWRLVEVLKREEIAELQPEDIAIEEPTVVEDAPSEPDVIISNAVSTHVKGPPLRTRLPLPEDTTTGWTSFCLRIAGALPIAFAPPVAVSAVPDSLID